MSSPRDPLEKPRLRELEVVPVEAEGEHYYLFRDPHGISDEVVVAGALGPLLQLLDGSRSSSQIVADYAAATGDELAPDEIDVVLNRLDVACLLDSQQFAEVRRARLHDWKGLQVRPPALAGRSYPEKPAALRVMLDEHYREAAALAQDESVRGAIGDRRVGRVRGCVVPHIDFARGGAVEALAYRPLLDEQFDVLVILGIAHNGLRFPYCLTSKDFETPLGTALCDHEFCAALQTRVGPRLTDEEWAHRGEHSVEFVATFLQHNPALAKARIVPLLCGGLFDELRSGSSPATNSDVARFCQALREVTSEWEERGQRVGFIVSVDGAHMGTQFGDETPLTPDVLQLVEAADREFWGCVSKGDIEAMHNHLARDNNARNVDAHPALYALWHAFPHLRAELQHYRQAYNRQQNCMVSFAALTLYQP